jgi:hypothetical protein
MSFANDVFQFYPTPGSLARRAWAKFQNRNFVCVLEPSAGDGALAEKMPDHRSSYKRQPLPIDCIEIDITKHALLREKGFSVVGVDFMEYAGAGAMYSHTILNPPFLSGANHVLKVWDIMFDGEIVAILNAQTIRSPHTKERQMLVDLIKRYGSVEFLEGAFTGPEVARETDVDVALVYLKKTSDFHLDLVGTILDDLKQDQAVHGLHAGYRELHELALPNSSIENSVLAFNAAVRAMKESVQSEIRSSYYSRLLGETLEQKNNKEGKDKATESSLEWVRNTMQERYADLKNRAWAGILRGTQVTSRLSSAAQQRLESEFENLKTLEFTPSNIYGFLHGLIESQGDIQTGMCLDVFDLITRYYTDNTCFFRGWKSNDAHRTAGISIKTTRFILPGHQAIYGQTLNWASMRMISDFDKVFALLDGRSAPEVSLEYVFSNELQRLRNGERVASSYFDVRYYQGIGTIHFFPKGKKLVDRLNRLVGHHRAWLPPAGTPVSEQFWLQFEQSEKFDKEIQAEIKATNRGGRSNLYWDLRQTLDPACQQRANDTLDRAISKVHERHGIDVDALIEQAPVQAPLLLCA